MTQRTSKFVFWLLLFIGACGGTDALKDNLGSCNLRPTAALCIDYTGVDWRDGKSQEDCAGQTGGSFSTNSSCLLDTSYLGACVSETTAGKGVTRRYFQSTASTTYTVTSAQTDCTSAAVAGTWYVFTSPTN